VTHTRIGRLDITPINVRTAEAERTGRFGPSYREMSSLPVPLRLRPVTLKCSRVDVELSANAREKLVRRVRHLDGAAGLVGKLDGAHGPVELTTGEKGFLVVAITAWAEAAGRGRVPGELLRLQTTLLGDLYYPVEAAEPAPERVSERVVEAPAAPPEPEPDPRLVAVRRARAVVEQAAAELAAALER
jgi:hypothetical protein